MKKMDFQKVFAWLSFALKCPICGYQYNLERTKVIESKQSEKHNQANLLVHSDCLKCASSVVFSIAINGPEVFSIGMITDLTGEDSADFVNKQALTANDVHEVHNFLNKFDGNFVKVFKNS